MGGRIKAVIFDLDGVLYDTKKANAIFTHRLLTAAGYPVSIKQAAALEGVDDKTAVRMLTQEKSPKKLREVWNIYRTADFPGNLVGIPEGIDRTLTILSKRYKLAIVTNAIRKGVDDLFLIKDLRKYFPIVVTQDYFSRPKPHPDPLLAALKKLKVKPGEAIYVGDREIDMLASKAAHMSFIGYDELSRVKFARKTVVAHSFPDILKKIGLFANQARSRSTG